MILINEAADYCVWGIRQFVFENKVFDYKILPFAEESSKFPVELALTTTNLCNLKCVWCYTCCSPSFIMRIAGRNNERVETSRTRM